MRTLILSAIILSVFLYSCKSNRQAFAETGDAEITIEAQELPASTGDRSPAYKIRIIPAKKMLNKLTAEDQKRVVYNTDSCFYTLKNRAKIYASLIQPVANGVKGTYEYLVVFDKDNFKDDLNMKLVYKDGFINHKIYTMTFNEE